MKKLILKIVSIVAAFLLGIVCMSYFQTAGNNDLTVAMSNATLPLIYMEQGGRLFNLMHGYTKPMKGNLMRDGVLPIPDDRTLKFRVESPDATVKKIAYEIRSLDTSRLIEDMEIPDYRLEDGQIHVQFQLKDLLEPGEEYLLVIRLELAREKEVFYYTRLLNTPETHLTDCLSFAEVIHDATFDKENTVAITQYLEPDSSADNNTLEHVTIHSRYKQIIWGDMEVAPASEVRLFVTELDSSITSFRMEYEVSHENESGETEIYEVQESYRVRYTDQRMYLLDYDRIMNRVFDTQLQLFSRDAIQLGILDTEVEYQKNEEENIVGFVQNGELWCFDVAQNKLSYVFGFRDGDDLRCNYSDHGIKIIDVDESGSMYFLVYGYMNRGIHEGQSGVAVYFYDAITNSVEEHAFIESTHPFQLLQTEVGNLAYVNRQKQLYLYFQGNISKIDLNTRECTNIVTGISEDRCMISDDGRTVAWQQNNSLYEAESVEVLSLETGRRRSIAAEEGFYIRALGFMGTDFIYGEARKEDIQKNMTGNRIFPMGHVVIQDASGSVRREFAYEDQGKYVLSISIEDNRISLECVRKNVEGGYEDAPPEPITHNAEETVEKIALDTKNSGVKKREYFFSLSEGKADAKLKYLAPRQVLFEGSRNIQLEEEEESTIYYAYAFHGKFIGAYSYANEAIQAAYEKMGVVVDNRQAYIWERGNRKTRAELTNFENLQEKPEETSLQGALEILLSTQNIFTDIAPYLESGNTPYEILSEHSNGQVLDLSGCSVSMVLYFVSQGYPVLALGEGSQAELIIGYDPQNIILTNPQTGETYRRGMNDSTEMFESLGNLFLVCLPSE